MVTSARTPPLSSNPSLKAVGKDPQPTSSTSSTAPLPTEIPTPGSPYVVKRGDTLSALAQRAYGDPSRWRDIAEANPGIVTESGHIKAGDTIGIPNARADRTEDARAGHQRLLGHGPRAPAHDAGERAHTPVATDLQSQLLAQMSGARLGQRGTTPKAHGHDANGTTSGHGATGHGETHGAGHGDGHHDVHHGTNFNSGANVAKADGHSTGTHLGDVSHMPLEETLGKKSWGNKNHKAAQHAEGHGGGHDEHHGGVQTSANATLLAAHNVSRWHSAIDGGTLGEDPNFMADKTGAAGEVHSFAARTTTGAALGVDLKQGKVIAGGEAGIEADLVGVSGKAQLGTANSVAGQGYVHGEAHLGAKAAIGGGVTIDPRKGSAKVSVGGEAFAGGEVKVGGGYQNRYGGVSAEVRGQAGVGVAGQAEIGFDKGVFKAKADLGACVGLGGRVAVDVNVNVGAMLKDAGSAVMSWFD